MILKRHSILVLATLLALGTVLPAARAASPYRVPVHFAWTNDAGVGNNWFVVGDHPDVGGWDVLRAVPLAWHEGNVWSADVGIKAGTELKYKFVKRPTNASDYPDGSKTEWIDGGDLERSVPAEPPAPVPGKRVVFLCDWPEPVELWYSMLDTEDFESTNEWRTAEMRKTGEGRFEIDGVGEAGEWMRFTFHQPGNDWWYHFRPTDDEETDFWCPLDAFCVRDGQVFNYEPVPTAEGWVSASRIVSTNVNSSNPSVIAGREIRIYLPRGYDENTDRRYPVVYFSDGQNVFQPGGTYGCWNAEIAADREIRAGHMREAILVAVPCRTDEIPGVSGSSEYARLWEYLPSTDNLMGIAELPGLGAKYADFLINNVKPTLDYNFRTRGDRLNTVHIGSSAGGLLSLYLGTTYGDVFGMVAPMSGVYNEEYIPNFRRWCLEHPDAVAKPERVWLDTGTEETAIGDEKTMILNLYESNWDALTLLLYAGHVHNKSLHFGVYSGWQGEHNEPAWAARIDKVYDFLLPVTDESNPLLPVDIEMDGMTMKFPVYGSTAYSVLSVGNAMGLCNHAVATTNWTCGIVDRPWSNASYTVTQPGFYWVEGR